MRVILGNTLGLRGGAHRFVQPALLDDTASPRSPHAYPAQLGSTTLPPTLPPALHAWLVKSSPSSGRRHAPAVSLGIATTCQAKLTALHAMLGSTLG